MTTKESFMRETKKNSGARMEWKKVDLHLHTPGSADYLETGVSYLDILRRAEERGLDVIESSPLVTKPVC